MKKGQVQLYYEEASRTKLLTCYLAKYDAIHQEAIIASIEMLTENIAFLFGTPVNSVTQYGDTLRHMINPEISIQVFEIVWENRRKEYYAQNSNVLHRHSLDNLTRAQKDFRRMFDRDASYYQEHFPALNDTEIAALSQAMQEILLEHTKELLTMLEPIEYRERPAEDTELARRFRRVMKEIRQPGKPERHVTWVDEVNKDDAGRDGPAQL
jgi:hypothetical protein